LHPPRGFWSNDFAENLRIDPSGRRKRDSDEGTKGCGANDRDVKESRHQQRNVAPDLYPHR
jgi:hypothetical protein